MNLVDLYRERTGEILIEKCERIINNKRKEWVKAGDYLKRRRENLKLSRTLISHETHVNHRGSAVLNWANLLGMQRLFIVSMN